MDNALLLAGACEQARAIARGQISAVDLLSAQYALTRQRNPVVRAFVALAPPPEELPGGDSLLAGTSFAVKDNIHAAGLPTAAGLRVLEQIALSDAPMVASLRQAGMHCMGKLNMHPMALGATNHNPDYGDCIHPAYPGYTAGGSSGGSAAAVAAGLCGIALGTDTMGSVRLPAAYCGVVGFKPSHESLGLDGVVPLSRLLDHVGVLARRVEDVGAAMRIMAPHLPDGGQTPRIWRVGVVMNAQEYGAQAAVVSAFRAGAALVGQQADIEVVPMSLEALDPSAVRRAGLLLCETELHPMLAGLVDLRPEALPTDLLRMMRYAAGLTGLQVGQAVSMAAAAAEHLETLTRGLDALLLPTTPQTSFPMDAQAPVNQADFTALANMSGAPAISLPLPVPAGQLPVGLQLIGHRGHDHALLRLAERVESALRTS